MFIDPLFIPDHAHTLLFQGTFLCSEQKSGPQIGKYAHLKMTGIAGFKKYYGTARAVCHSAVY
jgi:hypothetical protein